MLQHQYCPASRESVNSYKKHYFEIFIPSGIYLNKLLVLQRNFVSFDVSSIVILVNQDDCWERTTMQEFHVLNLNFFHSV
jgi:hypothetical protein